MTAGKTILLAAMLVLSGCATQYEYLPPTTAEGRACAIQCQATQASCRARQDQRATAAFNQCKQDAVIEQNQCLRESVIELQQCQHDADIEYGACLKYAHNETERNACKRKSCNSRSCDARSCYNSANYDLCDSDFRLCYQTCGGQVREVQ